MVGGHVPLTASPLVLGGHFVSSRGLSRRAERSRPARPHRLLESSARSLHLRTGGRLPSKVAWRDFEFASLLKNSSVSFEVGWKGGTSIGEIVLPIVLLVADAILIANRHFIFLCISIQHGILAAFIFILPQLCFLFVFSIQSSSSSSAVSNSLSESLAKETSLS